MDNLNRTYAKASYIYKILSYTAIKIQSIYQKGPAPQKGTGPRKNLFYSQGYILAIDVPFLGKTIRLAVDNRIRQNDIPDEGLVLLHEGRKLSLPAA